MTQLQLLSLILLLIYFAIILSTLAKSRKSKNIEDYFLAGRRLSFGALAITFIASWWGAGSAVETADKAFSDGISAFWIYGMPVLVSTFLIFLFSKAIRKIGTITQPQLLEQRYGKKAALILSVLIFIFMTITAASQVVGIGIFFESFLGIDYNTAAIVGSLIVLTYSLFGGFKGVVLTDIVQFVFLIIAAVLVFIYAYINSGGFSAVSSLAIQKGMPEFFSFSHKIGSNMVYVITFGCAWMIQANVWQRISATKTPTDAKKMIGLSFLIYIPLYLMVTLTGMLSLGLFDSLPDGGVVPAIINTYMNPILGAFMFVGICSAIMSTMDSLLNTGAMVLCIDIYRDRLHPEANGKQMVWAGKISTLIVTVIAVLIGLEIRSILKVGWIAADFLATGAFIPLVLGFIWLKGTNAGALASMLFGGIFSLYNLAISLGVSLPAYWEINSATQILTGMSGSLIIYLTVSLATYKKDVKAINFIRKAGFLKEKPHA